MVKIKADDLKRKYNKVYRGNERYAKIIDEVRSGKQNNVILDFNSRKECSQGYNSIWYHMKRHDIKLFIAMRKDDYCQVYRLVLSNDRKRRDLLERSDDACRKDEVA